MKRYFFRYMFLISFIHIFIIMILVVSSAIPNQLTNKKNEFVPVKFFVESTESKPNVSSDIKKPLISPVLLDNDLSLQKQKSRNRVEVSKHMIQRGDIQNAKNKRLTKEEIRERLDFRTIKSLDSSATSESNNRYMDLIHRVLYEAWDQPRGDFFQGANTVAKIGLNLDGNIISRIIVTGSGNAAMDASVLDALNRIHRIHGLSDQFVVAHKLITIKFEVKK